MQIPLNFMDAKNENENTDNEITLDDWADVMDGSADDATRERVRKAMNDVRSPLNSFLNKMESGNPLLELGDDKAETEPSS